MPDKILCRFHTQGNCRYGSACRFSHDLTGIPSQVCSYFLAGYCAYGRNCHFAHLQPDGTPVPGEDVEMPRARELDSTASSASFAEEPGAIRQQPHAYSGRADAAWQADEASWGGYADETYQSYPQQEHDYDEEACDNGTEYDPGYDDAWQDGEAEAVESAHDVQQTAQHRGLPLPVDLGDAWQSTSTSGDSNKEECGQITSGSDSWETVEDAVQHLQFCRDRGISISIADNSDPSSPENTAESDPSGVHALTRQLQTHGGVRQLQDICPDYSRSGICSRGASCKWVHGVYCKTCRKFALDPTDAEQRAEHARECLRRHQRVQALAMSQEVECNICMDVVMAKDRLSERKFGLLSCDHAFCLGCIRSWRSNVEGGADVSSALRTCPVCRQTTHFVTPSMTWPTSKEDKAAVVEAYKCKLSQIDCRHFSFGDRNCPFGTSCMYKHAYRNGELEERSFRKRLNAEGQVEGLQSSRLSDFVASSLQAQQALRRSLRRTAYF